MDRERNRGFGLLFGLLILLLFVSVTFIALPLLTSDRMLFDTIASVFPQVATLLFSVIAIFWLLVKYHEQREAVPHLSISHDVSHFSDEDNFVHINVTANLHNSSKVQVKIRKAELVLFQALPVLDDKFEILASTCKAHHIPWQLSGKRLPNWDELSIEPGQTIQLIFAIKIPKSVKSILVHTHFSNPCFDKKSEHNSGWRSISFYDIARLAKPGSN